MRRVHGAAICLGAILPILLYGQETPSRPAWQVARELEQTGRTQEAFAKYLEAGMDFAAVYLGKSKPREFLPLLEKQAQAIGAARHDLIRGDLLLAAGEKAEARAALLRVAGFLNGRDQAAQEQVPSEPAYFVEPPERLRSQDRVMPFTAGCGSHTDNWLLRRLIALEAWDEAAAEFARVWTYHRRRAQRTGIEAQHTPGQEDQQQKALEQNPQIEKAPKQEASIGFDPMGLRFATDYAFFLKRREKPETAHDILLEALLLIDMDRNPEHAGDRRTTWSFIHGGSVGLSRKEFIRLAYGQFKDMGKSGEIEAKLLRHIEAGENRLRAVLAQIRLNENRPDDALRLQIEYLEAARLPAWTLAYRRGRTFEDARRPREAIQEFERALKLPFNAGGLPDPDEEETQSQFMRQRPGPWLSPRYAGAEQAFSRDLFDRLRRLCVSVGEQAKSLEALLAYLDTHPALLEDGRSLDEFVERFALAGQKERYQAWARERAATATSASARANLLWTVGDHTGAIRAVSEMGATLNEWSFQEWSTRFRGAGKEPFREFLKAVVQKRPDYGPARLALLDLDREAAPVSRIELLERLLDSSTTPAFVQFKGARNDTQFLNYYDLSYRLMRLYEKAGQTDKLRALGLRILRREKPFDFHLEPSQYEYRDENNLPEHLNACLALAVQHLDTAAEAEVKAYGAALERFGWNPALAQYRRRVAGGWQPRALEAFGWAGAPKSLTLLASNANVLSLSRDDRYVYAGHPWGVAVYDFAGRPITRVALGEAAMALASQGRNLWVGGPKGLFRIRRDDWSVQHQYLNIDLEERERQTSRRPDQKDPYDYYSDNGVRVLALDGESLWIGTTRNIQVLNTKTLDLRAFSASDLKADHRIECDFILIEKDYVWADFSGLRRYDRKTGIWQIVAHGGQPVRLIGDVDGTLCGSASLPDPLRCRPCTIDRKTLAVNVLPIEGSRQDCFNGPFSCYAMMKGRPVFGDGCPAYEWDRERGQLLRIDDPWAKVDTLESAIPKGLRSAFSRRDAAGTWHASDSNTHRHKLADCGFFASKWTMLELPDGTQVVGGKVSRSPRYEYPHEDRTWANDSHECFDEEGGLFFLKDGTPRCVSDVERRDVLRGDMVFTMVGGAQAWLCTNRGLAALDPHGQITGLLGRQEGLCANRILDGVKFGDRHYFATGWGDSGGGLAVLDHKTGVLTALFDADGLASDKLAGVGLDDNRLALTYQPEYQRHGGGNYVRMPPGRYEPATGEYAGEKKPQPIARDQVREEAPLLDPLPWLGGFVVSRHELDGREVLCGTRGVVIRSKENSPELAFESLGARLVRSADQESLARAKTYQRITTVRELETALKDENPYSRANALAATAWKPEESAAFVPVIAAQLADPNMRVRSTALVCLTRMSTGPDLREVLIPVLQTRLDDPEPYLCVVAAVEMARHGVLADLKHFREALARPNGFGNLPYGATSSIGVMVDARRIFPVLAPLCNEDVLGLLIDRCGLVAGYGFRPKDGVNEPALYQPLAAYVLAHREAAMQLLRAHGQRSEDIAARRTFAQYVFFQAGQAALPLLHEALTSKDRVVRSNAARACGAIKDPSSIPVLIQALDLESGLARASIVWALGELKAREAIPHLVNLYAGVAADDRRRAGAGFRSIQNQVQTESEYRRIANLDALGTEWDELKASAGPTLHEPANIEELISTRMLFEALRSIGPELAGDFYRNLAVSPVVEARMEAAVCLSLGPPGETEKNRPVLRNLLADEDRFIRLEAGISLVVLGDEAGRPVILKALEEKNSHVKRMVIHRLLRVRNGSDLTFLRKELKQYRDLSEADPTYDRDGHKEAVSLLERMERNQP